MNLVEAPLHSVAEIIMGQSPDGVHYNVEGDGKPLITGSGQMGDKYPRCTQFSRTGAKTSRPGDIILSIRASIGDLNWSDRDYYLGRGVAAIRPGRRLDPGYCWWALHHMRSKLEQRATGSTFKQVKTEDVSGLLILLPSIGDQRRIAAILDKADALRQKRRLALQKIDSLTQSIFFDMFGDPARNPRTWETCRLGDVIADGPQNGLYKPAESYGTGTPILRIDAFYDGEVTDLSALKRVRLTETEIESYGLHERDIVVNRVNSREYLGKSALITGLLEQTVFESNMMRFRVDARKAAPEFLVPLLQTRHIKAQILQCCKDAVNQSSINQDDVKSFTLILPPLQTQEEFGRRVAAIKTRLRSWRRSEAQVNSLFCAVQHRAFRGDL